MQFQNNMSNYLNAEGGGLDPYRNISIGNYTNSSLSYLISKKGGKI